MESRGHSRSRMRGRRGVTGQLSSIGKTYSDIEGTLTKSRQMGVSKWLGQEGNNNESGMQKKLLFAGIKNNQVRPGAPARQNSLRQNSQDIDERIRRAVYDNITRNFDIFEFIESNNEPHAIQHPNEGDDEMSDGLEFQIDDDDHRLEHLQFDLEQQRRRVPQASTGPILGLDFDDEDEEEEEEGNEVEGEGMKRRST